METFSPRITRLSPYEREHRNGHSSCLIWLTGLPAADKFTIAVELEHRLIQQGFRGESALASMPFSGMLFEPAHAGCHKMKRLIKPALLLAIVSVCLFGYVLQFPKRGISRVSSGVAVGSMDAAGLPCHLVRHFYFPDVQPE